MTDALMADVIPAGAPATACKSETVTVEHELGRVCLALGDGTRVWFDRDELVSLVEDPDAPVIEEHEERVA